MAFQNFSVALRPTAAGGRARSALRAPRRVSHAAAAVVLVLATGAVVAQSMVRGVTAGLFPEQIHVPGWTCHLEIDAVPHRRALVLYDSTGPYAAYGAQAAALAANFVSRFAWPVRQPVTSYRRGEMAHYAAVVYVGTNYGEPLPRSFLSDARAGMRPLP